MNNPNAQNVSDVILGIIPSVEVLDAIDDDERRGTRPLSVALSLSQWKHLIGLLRARELQQAQVVGVPYGIIDPDYARIFTIARVLAWSEGYALTMHGSFTRDLDLVAVPWTDRAREPEHLARRIIETCGLKDTASNPGIKPHGRLVWTMRLPDFGDPRFVDFSILSTPQSSVPVVGDDARDAARYRWLRDVSVPPHNFYISVPVEFHDERYTPAQVDAAIDQAIESALTGRG